MMDETAKGLAVKVAQFIEDHKGIDTTVIDVSDVSGWADCFIVATVNSLGHLRGMARELWGFLVEQGVSVLNRHKTVSGDGWELIDCGQIVIHLMSADLREFYALEKLWHAGTRLDFMRILEEEKPQA